MDTSHIAHQWAASALDGFPVKLIGKNTGKLKSSNFYWEGGTIYSYGTHFPIANTTKNSKGKTCVLFTRAGYSVTTAKHKHEVRGALSGRNVTVFDVARAGVARPDMNEERQFHENQVKAAFLRAATARTNGPAHLSTGNAYIQAGNQMAAFWGWKWRIAAPKNLVALTAQLKAQALAQGKKTRAENIQARAALPGYLSALETAWRTHQNKPECPSNRVLKLANQTARPTWLRVTSDGLEIETSRGARVPKPHAVRLWGFILKVKASGQAWEKNGHTEHVGSFSVDRIEADGTLRVGCHVIAGPEVDRMAAVLGLSK